MNWIITNSYDPELCWNDTSKTWEYEDYDTFGDAQKLTMVLPLDGLWEMVPWAIAE